MRYHVEVLDGGGSRVACLTGLAHARLMERMNGRGILTIETIEPRDWSHIVAGTSFLRVHSGNAVPGTYRVIETQKTRARERIALTVTARHIIADTASELFTGAVNCINYTPAELLALVLDHSAFTPGRVEPEMPVPFVRFEYEPVHTCLLRICSLTGGELSLDEATGELSLLDRVGTSNGASIRYGLNLRGASRTVSVSMMANRVWGVGGGDPPLLLNMAPSGDGNAYVEDAESIAAWGLVEDVCHEPTLEHVVNLIATPALDGVYTGNLCEDWNVSGNPALSVVTTGDAILYGRASQRVESAADGEGIAQTVSVPPGTVYSLVANLFITDGTVRVKVIDGATEYRREAPVTGAGFVAVKIENWKANSETVTVAIIQEGAGTADFTVDSVQLAAGAHTLPFTVGDSADTLRDRTLAYLDARKEPAITYAIDLVDLSGGDGLTGDTETFGLGDTVSVIDPTLGLDIKTRVMERDIDLLRPRQVGVHLDNAARTLADVFAALRDVQEKGIRLQRAAFAESSNAAEEGSVRLGFANSAFRFYGRVTPVDWDRVTWSGGILRVGVGYYAIQGSSLIGFPANATRYIYFDRTNPAQFGMTADIAAAEGADRILIFAITTTTSPELCVVHPMGAIHD